MTPGLVVSNRRTKGSTDNGGIQVNLPWFKYERLAKFRKMGLVQPFPPLPMLQTFPVMSIKTQLKILIMNICCLSKKCLLRKLCSHFRRSPVEFSVT
jgi:hypothetical protein